MYSGTNFGSQVGTSVHLNQPGLPILFIWIPPSIGGAMLPIYWHKIYQIQIETLFNNSSTNPPIIKQLST